MIYSPVKTTEDNILTKISDKQRKTLPRAIQSLQIPTVKQIHSA